MNLVRFYGARLVLLFASALLFGLSSSPLHAQTPTSGFQATYFDGTMLQGAPILTRNESAINWSYAEGGSPAPGVVPPTNFSTRWQGWYAIDRAGAWTLTFISDDGGRVWIDNELVIDQWYDHGTMTRALTKNLAAGYHLLRVEYFQKTGDMTAQLILTPSALYPDWMGEYFDNPYLLGEPRYRRNERELNFNWGSGSPEAVIPSDNFSARWTRQYNFPAGNYTFTATADDGVRVWVGDILAIDAWMPQQPQTYTRTLYLDGTYPLRVEYFEEGGQAVLNFFLQPAKLPVASTWSQDWRGEFFGNANLTPPAACSQNTNSIQFNWQRNSPGCALAPQFFSARWESTTSVPTSGFYTINLFVDDGARVFIDNELVLEAWREQAPTRYSTTVYLQSGEHKWRVEYFQSTGSAQIFLDVAAGVTPPSSAPTTGAEVVVNTQAAGWTQSNDAGAWQTLANAQEGNALWTNNNAFMQAASNWGRWYPPALPAGKYEVSAFIPSGIATTTNARYWIYHAGEYDAVSIPQAQYNDVWVSLGTFYFTGQGGEFVSLSDVTYEPSHSTKIVWSAMKFSAR